MLISFDIHIMYNLCSVYTGSVGIPWRGPGSFDALEIFQVLVHNGDLSNHCNWGGYIRKIHLGVSFS